MMMEKLSYFCLCEALLFSLSEPVREDVVNQIADEFFEDGHNCQFSDFVAWYETRNSGLQLINVAGGWQLVTKAEFNDAIRRLRTTSQKARFSRASLETLAIIAYRQPITAPEIENIRGVESTGILKNLLEKKVITVLGRKRGPGNPLLYGTTQQFLSVFGLIDLESLPGLEEFENIADTMKTFSDSLPFPNPVEEGATTPQENSNEN